MIDKDEKYQLGDLLSIYTVENRETNVPEGRF